MSFSTNTVIVFIIWVLVISLIIAIYCSVKFRRKKNPDGYLCKFLPDGTIRSVVSCRLEFQSHEIRVSDFSVPMWNIGEVVMPYIGIREVSAERSVAGVVLEIVHFEGRTRVITNEPDEIVEKINKRTQKHFSIHIV